MIGLNRHEVIGRLGSDPECRDTAGGTAVAIISVASSYKYKDKGGEMVDGTDWIRYKFFGRIAEIVAQYGKKGMLVYCEGAFKSEKYTDKSGAERYDTYILGNKFDMLSKKQSDDEEPRLAQPRPPQAHASPAAAVELTMPNDDIPF